MIIFIQGPSGFEGVIQHTHHTLPSNHKGKLRAGLYRAVLDAGRQASWGKKRGKKLGVTCPAIGHDLSPIEI
jgi:hypothetical protein